MRDDSAFGGFSPPSAASRRTALQKTAVVFERLLPSFSHSARQIVRVPGLGCVWEGVRQLSLPDAPCGQQRRLDPDNQARLAPSNLLGFAVKRPFGSAASCGWAKGRRRTPSFKTINVTS
jgi:hypothetical protein